MEHSRTERLAQRASGPQRGASGPTLPPTGSKARRHVLSKDDVRALLRAVGGAHGAIRDTAMIRLAYYGALRVSELCGATVGGYNQGRRRLVVWRPKVRSWHEIALHDDAAHWLEKYLGVRRLAGREMFLDQKSPLFLSQRRGHLATASFFRILRGWAEAAGIVRVVGEKPIRYGPVVGHWFRARNGRRLVTPKPLRVPVEFGPEYNVHPHCLRHSRAVHLIEDGEDLSVVQALLGHRSLDTTSAYVALSEGFVSEAVRRSGL